MVKSVIFASSIAVGGASTVPLATFGASDDTLRTWRETNDPVMGGKSTGKFTVDSDNAIGTMEGTVAIVPSLSAPGFINVQASGKYADVSSCDGIELDIRVTSDPYDGWRFSFGNDRSACGQFFARGYHASFTPPAGNGFGKVQIPFDEFTRCWSDSTGEAIKTCADDSSVCPTSARLSDLQSLEVWAEGAVGDVKIDMKSVSAYGCNAEPVVSAPQTDFVPLATFGASDDTLRTWRETNDPVMGGKSSGTFTVDSDNAIGTMEGTVAIVPSLSAPGFINVQASGTYADVSTCDGIELDIRVTSDPYDGWRFSFGNDRSACGQFFARGYHASFSPPAGNDFGKVQIPFTEFTRCWSDSTGEAIKTCADDASVCPTSARLQNLQSLQVWAEGAVGDVKIDMRSVGAYGCGSALAAPMATVPLTTFDGADETTQKWVAMNDPVMGGQSKATFTVANNVGVFDGAVAIVPSLQAPGFCTMETPRVTLPDISGADAIQVVARQSSEYKGWRFTIGDAPRNPDSGAPFFVKGQYKANVAIPVSDEFQTITIPFTDFTYKWSDTTGEPTVKCADDASVCPDEKHLKAPRQLAIMAEGVEGSFHLEVQSITAVNTASMTAVLV